MQNRDTRVYAHVAIMGVRVTPLELRVILEDVEMGNVRLQSLVSHVIAQLANLVTNANTSNVSHIQDLAETLILHLINPGTSQAICHSLHI